MVVVVVEATIITDETKEKRNRLHVIKTFFFVAFQNGYEDIALTLKVETLSIQLFLLFQFFQFSSFLCGRSSVARLFVFSCSGGSSDVSRSFVYSTALRYIDGSFVPFDKKRHVFRRIHFICEKFENGNGRKKEFF